MSRKLGPVDTKTKLDQTKHPKPFSLPSGPAPMDKSVGVDTVPISLPKMNKYQPKITLQTCSVPPFLFLESGDPPKCLDVDCDKEAGASAPTTH